MRLAKCEHKITVPTKYINTLEVRIKKLENALRIYERQNIVSMSEYLKKLSLEIDHNNYWILNKPIHANEQNIRNALAETREKHTSDVYHKHIQQRYFNNTNSFEDVQRELKQIYDSKSSTFKIHIVFGYITEHSFKGNVDIYKPSQQYVFDNINVIRNKENLETFMHNLTGEHVLHRIGLNFQNSSTRLLGVYSMDVKTIDLDYPIGDQ